MLQKLTRKRLTRLQGSAASGLAHVNAINQLVDAVESLQGYVEILHDAIKELEAKVKK